MRIDTVQRAKFMQQITGRLWPHSGYAGNIIRAVAHQSLKVHQTRRRKAVFRFKNLRRIIQRRCLPALRADKFDRHMRIDQLQAIAVSCQDDAVPVLFAAGGSYRPDDIVRLPALTLINRNIHRSKDLLHDRHLHGKLLRHSVPRCLVAFILQVAEGRPVQIEGNAERIRLFLRGYFLQNVQKAEDRIRIKAVTRRQRTYPVKCAVDDTVAVQNHQFHSNVPLFRRAGRQLPAACL